MREHHRPAREHGEPRRDEEQRDRDDRVDDEEETETFVDQAVDLAPAAERGAHEEERDREKGDDRRERAQERDDERPAAPAGLDRKDGGRENGLREADEDREAERCARIADDAREGDHDRRERERLLGLESCYAAFLLHVQR